MLEYLRIRNLALIEDMELEFSRGINVLTGETGAGKSFILKPLGFLRGTGWAPTWCGPVPTAHRWRRFLPCATKIWCSGANFLRKAAAAVSISTMS